MGAVTHGGDGAQRDGGGGHSSDHVTARWRPANGEPYPMPHTDELVVFEDYFWHGLGLRVHPFLQDLLEF